ncbi:hypothetical protein M3Y94_00738400 [Aphelenchoides besseyi]|nr:hypothetical protein M3Y94_00738400 [Aphelenchoides besseyi]KAI6231958.1 hypothetical protein M3Y95_00436400 [Aphelenchoides besseyi]
MKSLFVLLCVVFVVVLAQNNGGNNGDRCPKYYNRIRNSHGQWRCMPNQDACRNTNDWVSSSHCKSICDGWKTHCSRASHCFHEPCNSCRPVYYDSDWNQVCH